MPPTTDTAALGRRIAGIAQEAGLGAAALAFLETINGPEVLRRLPPDAVARFEREGRGAVADSALLGFRPDGLRGILAPVIVGVGGRSRGPYVQIADDLVGRIARLARWNGSPRSATGAPSASHESWLTPSTPLPNVPVTPDSPLPRQEAHP